MLFIVSTPIGNLKDITFRAIETLQSVDLIAAEDTRHTKKLLDHYNIKKPLTSYFEHNKIKKADQLIKELQSGKNIALVTDAGTPGISDPGFRLIKMVQEHGLPMTVIPGPTALIAALNLSGLPAHHFIFEGFLPVKSAARRKRLETLKGEERTLIFYEAPHRILKVLQDIQDILPEAKIVVTREITKKFEETIQGRPQSLLEHFSSYPPKGEFVMLISNFAHIEGK
ncbi:MAG: 16S rRNA (cytidine(1402)-2'-O)-methyltransferase [Candidatus Omnitrophica bacterium]|nr:16S rRNA (cytidine(1402)-2'-O)-methyltransferase [Candidatus Omnitrophota bacterium]